MPSVLFVCTGNICRSPMAAALFRGLLPARPDASAWRIESAGIWAGNGHPASPLAQAVMRKRGLDISAHRSRIVTGELLAGFDLILTMERGQQEALQVEFPHLSERVHLLSEIAGCFGEIEDPYRTFDLHEYEAAADEILLLLTAGQDHLLQLAGTGLP